MFIGFFSPEKDLLRALAAIFPLVLEAHWINVDPHAAKIGKTSANIF